ncbi:LOW QUALITY PROTEIN: AMP-binding enzyme, partial [Segatella buccae D17]
KGIFVVNNNVEDVFISYAELAEKSRKIAHVLNSYYAIQPKSKIIISVAKSEDFIMLFWGCVFANCVPVLMPSVRLNNKETVDYDRFKNAKEILGNPILISNDFNLCNAYENNNAIYIENIFGQMELVSDGEVCSPNIRKDELCVIQFSSGSTGNPRGVMLSFDKIIANIKAKTFADHITREDKLIHWMPYFHDYGLFGNHLVCVYNCITEVKVEPFSFLRDPVVFIQKIEQYDITVCGGTTPSGLELLSKKVKDKEQELKGIDLSHIKTLSVGAEMVPPNLFSRLEPLFKLGLRKEAYIPSYGMAETTLIVSACTHGYGNRTIKIERDAFYDGIIKPCNNDAPFCEFTSAGTVLPCFQVRIEKDGISQGNMQIGEIQVKGDCVMMGYYNDKKSTDAVFKEGWLCTGDLGFFDTNNILYIVGRKKEVIIVNGQNYHPFDLEDSIIKKFTGEIEKSVLTSYYSTKIEREVVLHFFTLYKDVAETDVQQLVKKVNGFIANIAGFAPAYSIHIKKGNIQRTSSSKIKRRSMALSFEKGMYNKFIVNLMDNSTKNYELILKTIWEEILHIENILPDDNFFSLGGDSIRSMIAVSKIEKAFNVKLENSFFYQYSCINAQSKYL